MAPKWEAREAQKAQKAQEAAEASPEDQVTRDTQEPLEAARFVTVSDDHGLYKVAHFATKDAALKRDAVCVSPRAEGRLFLDGRRAAAGRSRLVRP